MLVITRRVGETVCIGDGIVVHVSAIHGESVRLAFDAPTDVRVRRGETPAEPRRADPAA